jgi:hypothetical protein
MTTRKSPGAHHSDRGQEISLCGLTSHTIALPHTQRHRPPVIIGWAVDKWLGVSAVEVRRHD